MEATITAQTREALVRVGRQVYNFSESLVDERHGSIFAVDSCRASASFILALLDKDNPDQELLTLAQDLEFSADRHIDILGE